MPRRKRPPMSLKMKAMLISVAATVSAMLVIDQGLAVYDARKLPRPAWRSELIKVQGEVDLTRLIVLQQQIESTQSQINALLVAKATAQVVPPEFEDIEAKLNQQLRELQTEVKDIESRLKQP